jgi:hypothetical protein
VVVVVVLCWKHKEVAEAAAVEVEYPMAEINLASSLISYNYIVIQNDRN